MKIYCGKSATGEREVGVAGKLVFGIATKVPRSRQEPCMWITNTSSKYMNMRFFYYKIKPIS